MWNISLYETNSYESNQCLADCLYCFQIRLKTNGSSDMVDRKRMRKTEHYGTKFKFCVIIFILYVCHVCLKFTWWMWIHLTVFMCDDVCFWTAINNPVNSSSPCSSGWSEFNGRCFRFFPVPMSWASAQVFVLYFYIFLHNLSLL